MRRFSTLCALTVALVGLLFVPSCKEDVDLSNISTDVYYKTGFAVPVGQAKATLSEFFPTSGDDYEIDIDENGVIYLRYMTSFDADYREDLELSGAYNFTTPLDLSAFIATGIPSGVHIPFPVQIPLDSVNKNPAELRIDTAIIDELSLIVLLNPVDMTFSTSDLDSITIDFDKVTDAAGQKHFALQNIPGTDQYSVVLGQTHFILEGANTLDLTLNLSIKNNIALGATSALNLGFALTVGEYETVYGYITPDADLTWTSGSVDFSELVNDFQGINVPFAEPVIKAKLKSNVGVPALFEVRDMNVKSKSGVVRYAEFDNAADNHLYSYTLTNIPTNPGQIGTDSIVFDKSNGKINNLFKFDSGDSPLQLDFQYKAGIAPTTTSTAQFITRLGGNNKPFIDFDVDVILPLKFESGTYMSYTDTIDFDADMADNLADYIDSAYIEVTGENGIPLAAEAYLTFLDSLDMPYQFNQTLNSISIPGASTKADGSISSPTKYGPINIILSDDNKTPGTNELERFRQIRKVVYNVILKEPAVGSKINITKDDFITINLALKALGHYEGDPFND